MKPLRITIVTDELLGYTRTGGVGTASAFLALGLARMGHGVETLYTGELPAVGIDTEWGQRYEQAGVAVRLPASPAEAVEPWLSLVVRVTGNRGRG